MVVNDLEEIMFSVFENHEDAFVLKNDFDQIDNVRVREF